MNSPSSGSLNSNRLSVGAVLTALGHQQPAPSAPPESVVNGSSGSINSNALKPRHVLAALGDDDCGKSLNLSEGGSSREYSLKDIEFSEEVSRASDGEGSTCSYHKKPLSSPSSSTPPPYEWSDYIKETYAPLIDFLDQSDSDSVIYMIKSDSECAMSKSSGSSDYDYIEEGEGSILYDEESIKSGESTSNTKTINNGQRRVCKKKQKKKQRVINKKSTKSHISHKP
ncbi:MAG: hypothetical protein ACRC9R_10940, partial [Enterovibrio sp.]